jgi:gamma-glutamylcyclotransferase (GGCT)/AIG2-like uncharacterized protein YtfP
MKRSCLEERIGTVGDRGVATLKDNRIAFNKESKKDGTGKTNILPTQHEDVLGVIYEMSEEQLKILDGIEGGYMRIPMPVQFEGKITEVQTYVASPNRINNDLLPTADYLQKLIDGAKDHGFPQTYQDHLKSFEVCK